MSTTNVPVIGVNIASVSPSDMEKEEEKRRRESQVRVGKVTDSVEIMRNVSVAEAAEVAAPQGEKKGKHENMKEKRSSLKEAMQSTGRKFSEKEIEGERIEEKGQLLLEEVGAEIEGLKGKGVGGVKVARLEKMREKLVTAIEGWREARLDAADPLPQAVETVSARPGEKVQVSDQAEKLWKELGGLLPIRPEENGNIEKVQGRLFDEFKRKIGAARFEKKGIETRKAEIVDKLNGKVTPEEKARLEKELEAVNQRLVQVAQKQAVLQKDFTHANAVAENILKLEVASDLGVEDKTIKDEKNKGSAPLVGAQSLKRGKVAQNKGETGVKTSHEDAPLLGAASASGGDSDPSHPVASDAPLAQGTVFDNTGTLMTMQSVGQNLRSEAKKTDKRIKKLLAAALSGNWEAIKQALIYLDRRASTIVIGIGAQTIKAMQNYEKQMSATNANIAKLKGNEADYSAKLAGYNSEMNLYSLNRQSIANFLRDSLTMREEIANLTHSVLQKDSQIISSIVR